MNMSALEVGNKVHQMMEDCMATVAVQAQPVSRIKPTPKVGDTLWIKHEVKRSNAGEVLGLMRNNKPVKSTITAVFLDGSVRDNHSDCWEIKPSSLNNWETINPQREGKHQ